MKGGDPQRPWLTEPSTYAYVTNPQGSVMCCCPSHSPDEDLRRRQQNYLSQELEPQPELVHLVQRDPGHPDSKGSEAPGPDLQGAQFPGIYKGGQVLRAPFL